MTIQAVKAVRPVHMQTCQVLHLALLANVDLKVISYKLHVISVLRDLSHPMVKELVNSVQKINIHRFLEHVPVIVVGLDLRSIQTRLGAYFVSLDSFPMMKEHVNSAHKDNIRQIQVLQRV